MIHRKESSLASIIQEPLLNSKGGFFRPHFFLMKKILFFLALLISSFAFGQSIGYWRYDTVMLQKIGGNSELNILNGTRTVTNGVLTNVGNGRTRFVLPASPSVTGANNGDTLIAGNIGLGGTLIRQTRISASNNAFLLDSLGIGSTFKAYPNSSASVFRYFKIVNGNTSDSAYLWIGGKTAATTRDAQLGTNASVNNSKVEFAANNVSGTYVFGGITATSPTRISYVKIDTLSAFMASIKTSPSASQSYLYMYPDSMTFYQTDGDYYVYGLNRITDSTGLDLMAWDRSNSEWVRIPSDIVGGGAGATPNLQTVFAVESNSPVMTANANEIKLNPAGSSGVAKTFTLGATSFADDSRIFISNDGTGNGAFDVWAQDSANTNQVFLRSDITNKRVYLHSARGVASSANNLFVYSDSTVFQFTLGTADYRFKGVETLFYPDTTLNLPATLDAQGRLKRLAYWPSGGGGSSTWNGITDPTGDQALTFGAGESSTWTNSNTTEDLFTINSSTITTSSFLSLNSTSTALAAGNNLVELVMSGANGTNAITANPLRVSVTNTNATSGTNIAIDATASGATTQNYSVKGTGPVWIRANSSTAQAAFGVVANTVEIGSNGHSVLSIYSSSGSQWSVLDFNYAPFSHFYNIGESSTNELLWSDGGLVRLGRLANTGKWSFGYTAVTPSAWVTMSAGTATIPPNRFTAGVVLTTPLTGVQETDAANDLYFTNAALATAGRRGRVGMWGYIAKTATYTATNADYTIECTANTFTTTLPTAVGIEGRQYVITNSGAGVITLATTSSQTFVNVTATPTTLTLNQFNTVIVQSNGANWLRISSL